jgi:superfamily II DNA or RNA helicase
MPSPTATAASSTGCASANPDCRIFGVTATPNRGDKKGLREVFDNVADQVGWAS